MSTAFIIIGIILVVLAVFLVVCVLMQQGKDRSLSGAIAGSSDNYLGKGKTKSNDKLLSRATLIVAILFVVIVAVLYIMQDVTDVDKYLQNNVNNTTTTTTVAQ